MEIQYRPFSMNDIDCCAELAVDAWPIASLITEKEKTHHLMRAYVQLSLILSDYAEVCCNNDSVIGFLFGSIRKSIPNFNKRCESLKLLWGFITGKYGKIRKRFRFLGCFVLNLLIVEILCWKLDSEVELFVVNKEFRGQGIGKTLLDHFVYKAKEQNMKTVYLFTDIESNYNFYERYGFMKYKNFYDCELSLLKNRKVTSFIYYLEWKIK